MGKAVGKMMDALAAFHEVIAPAVAGDAYSRGRGGASMSGCRLLWAAIALAWLGVVPHRSVDAHGWYSNLRQPITGRPCCGDYDCRPLLPQQIRYTKGGGMQFFLDNEWRDVDPAVILEMPSPDSRVHACWNATDHRLLCVILPGTL